MKKELIHNRDITPQTHNCLSQNLSGISTMQQHCILEIMS